MSAPGIVMGAKEILGCRTPARVLGDDPKRGFHELARKWHPDACDHPRAADVMAKLTELRGLADELKKVFGYGEADLSIEDAIASAQRMYDVFHVVVASRSYAPASSMDRWRELLGEKVLVLEDYKALAELIVTTIALCRGMSAADATKGFTSKVTDMVLRSGVDALARSGDGGSSEIATL